MNSDAVYPTEELKTILRQGTYRPIPLDAIQIVQKPNVKDRANKLFFNPRTTQGFGDDDMAELEDSIAAKGLMQPMAVREMGDGTYELVWGERRTRALRALVERNQDVYTEGGEMLPASVVYELVVCRVLSDCDDERAIGLAWAENDKQVPLSDADAIDLCHRLAAMDYSRNEISGLLQKPASWMSHTFAFQEKLPPQVYTMLRHNEISRSYAIKILEQPQALRDDLARLAAEIAVERFEIQVATIEDEMDEIEEELVEGETAVALADSDPPEVRAKVRKRLARIEQKAAEVVARADKVKSTGVVHQQGDVDEAAKRSGLQGGKGLTVKSIYAKYINRADDLIKSGQDPKTGRSFAVRDLEIAKLVATGIAHGEKDLETLLRGHYQANKLWTADDDEEDDDSSSTRYQEPDWDNDKYLLDKDPADDLDDDLEEEDDLEEASIDEIDID